MSRRRAAFARMFILSMSVAWLSAAAASCAPKSRSQPAAEHAPHHRVHRGSPDDFASKLQRHEFNQSGLGADFRVVVYCADDAAARRAQAVVATRLDKLADLLDRSRPSSEIAQLEENAGIGSVRASDEFYALFRQLDRLATQSRG